MITSYKTEQLGVGFDFDISLEADKKCAVSLEKTTYLIIDFLNKIPEAIWQPNK
ncbi:MAG: hypothetical protein NTV43_09915 [Methylococcales bacterium]|nr:hypothetical protein [Methylococcales bacterium]